MRNDPSAPARSRVAALPVIVLAAACSVVPSALRPAQPPRATPAAAPDSSERAPSDLPLALALADDYVVRVVAEGITCSGALIDEQLVLTAHHCVAERTRTGDPIARDVEPATLRIELGGDYLPWGEVGVRALVAPPCGYAAGEGDVAVLVLERRLIGLATLAARLDSPPRLGEEIDPVGFGRCALSNDGVRRKHRHGGVVDRLRAASFLAEAAICPGDSGGPAVSREGGDVIGIVSASVMDGSEETSGRSEFVRLDHWRSVFANARLIADGAGAAELPPIEGCPHRAP
jgi:V8-like Glu-specific endopeptidase